MYLHIKKNSIKIKLIRQRFPYLLTLCINVACKGGNSRISLQVCKSVRLMLISIISTTLFALRAKQSTIALKQIFYLFQSKINCFLLVSKEPENGIINLNRLVVATMEFKKKATYSLVC